MDPLPHPTLTRPATSLEGVQVICFIQNLLELSVVVQNTVIQPLFGQNWTKTVLQSEGLMMASTTNSF